MIKLLQQVKALSGCRKLGTLVKARYHGRVIDHFENPRNVGSLDKNAKNVGTGLVGAPACGDVMKLQIQVGADGKTIEKAVFKVLASTHADRPFIFPFSLLPLLNANLI